MKLLNAFSIGMLDGTRSVSFQEISLDDARLNAQSEFEMGNLKSYVGHADTARLFSEILGVPIDARRESITLTPDEASLVGQYSGPRLPEGATQLPEGAAITWWLVGVEFNDADWERMSALSDKARQARENRGVVRGWGDGGDGMRDGSFE